MAHSKEEKEKHALFEQWALPHKDHLYTACLSLTRNPDDAADLFQETFLRAFRFFHQFTPGTNCRAWLLTIMYNAFRNRYAQRVRAGHMVDFDTAQYEYERKLISVGEANQDDPAEIILARLLDGKIIEALRALPEEYRSTLLLVDIEECTYEEAAKALGCPIGTIRSRLSRARRLLHQALRDYAQKKGLLKEK